MKQKVELRGFIFTTKNNPKQKQSWYQVKYFVEVVEDYLHLILFKFVDHKSSNILKEIFTVPVKEDKKIKLEAINTTISYTNNSHSFSITTSQKTYYFKTSTKDEKAQFLVRLSRLLYSSTKISTILLPNEVILQEIIKRGAWIIYMTGNYFKKPKGKSLLLSKIWLTNFRLILQVIEEQQRVENEGEYFSIPLDSIFEVEVRPDVLYPEGDANNIGEQITQANISDNKINPRERKGSLFSFDYNPEIEILELRCRNFLEVKLGFLQEDSHRRLSYLMENLKFHITCNNHSSPFFAISSIPPYYLTEEFYIEDNNNNNNNNSNDNNINNKNDNNDNNNETKISQIDVAENDINIGDTQGFENNSTDLIMVDPNLGQSQEREISSNSFESIDNIDDLEIDNKSESNSNLDSDNGDESNTRECIISGTSHTLEEGVKNVYTVNTNETASTPNSTDSGGSNVMSLESVESVQCTGNNSLLQLLEKFCYNEIREHSRLQVSLQQWKFTSILSKDPKKKPSLENLQIRFCQQILIPFDINDRMLKKASKAREGGEFPILTWSHSSLGAHLFICLRRKNNQLQKEKRLMSDPRLSPTPQHHHLHSQHHHGNTPNSPPKSVPIAPEYIEADMKYIEVLQQICKSNLHFADISPPDPNSPSEMPYPRCTSILLEQYSQANCKSSLMNLFKKLVCNRYIQSSSSPEEILELFTETNWISTTNSMLLNSICLTRLLFLGESVVIQSSTKDYYSVIQLSSLVQLLVDPYYRTLHGFCILLQKEWFSYSIGSSEYPTLMSSLRKSDPFFAPFIQFLDVVWKILQLLPNSFQFNSKLLLFLVDAINCGTLNFRRCSFFNVSFPSGYPIPSFSGSSPRRNVALESLLYEEKESIWFIIAFYSDHFISNSTVLDIDFQLLSASTLKRESFFPYYLQFTHKTSIKTIHEMINSDPQSIALTGVGLSSIPNEIIYLQYLKEIDFSYNNIYAIPPFLHKLQFLEKISFEGNYISFLTTPKNVTLFPDSLTILNVNYNRVHSISSSIFHQLSGLHELYLVGNNLIKLKKSIHGLKSIRVLDLDDNKLEDLPEEFGKLQNLEVLSITRNLLGQLPNSFTQLKNLEYLNVSRNDLFRNETFQVAESTFQAHFPNMKMLNTSYNPRFDTCFYTHMNSLVELYLRGFYLSHLPKAIIQLRGTLTVLDLKQNAFVNFPSEIVELVHLKTLNLSTNELSYIPITVSKLSNLTLLNLRRNALTREGLYGIGVLPALKYLDISKNPKNLYHHSKSHSLVLWANLGLLKNTLEKFRIGNKKWVSKKKLKMFLQGQYDLANTSIQYHAIPKILLLGPSNSGKSNLKKWLTFRYSKAIDHSDVAGNALVTATTGAPINLPPTNVNFNCIAPTGCVEITHHTFNFDTIANSLDINPSIAHQSKQVHSSVWDFGGDLRFTPAQQYFINAACSDQAIIIIIFNWLERKKHLPSVVEIVKTIKHQKLVPNIYLVGTHVDVLTRASLYSDAYTEKLKLLKRFRKITPSVKNLFFINASREFLLKQISSQNLLKKKNLNTDFSYLKIPVYLLYQIYLLEIEIFKHMRSDVVPFAYFDLITVLENERKRNSYLMLSNKELCDISRSCYIKTNFIKKTLFDLLNIGHIIQFGIPGQFYYSPQFVVELFESLYPSSISHYNPPKGGGMTEDSVAQCWLQKFPNKDIHSMLLFILQNQFDFICVFKKYDGSTTNSNLEAYITKTSDQFNSIDYQLHDHPHAIFQSGEIAMIAAESNTMSGDRDSYDVIPIEDLNTVLSITDLVDINVSNDRSSEHTTTHQTANTDTGIDIANNNNNNYNLHYGEDKNVQINDDGDDNNEIGMKADQDGRLDQEVDHQEGVTDNYSNGDTICSDSEGKDDIIQLINHNVENKNESELENKNDEKIMIGESNNDCDEGDHPENINDDSQKKEKVRSSKEEEGSISSDDIADDDKDEINTEHITEERDHEEDEEGVLQNNNNNNEEKSKSNNEDNDINNNDDEEDDGEVVDEDDDKYREYELSESSSSELNQADDSQNIDTFEENNIIITAGSEEDRGDDHTLKHNFSYAIAKERFKNAAELLAIIPQNFYNSRPSTFLREKFEMIKHLNLVKNLLIYHVPYVPLCFFSQIIVNIIQNVEIEMAWKKGIFCRRGDEVVLMEIFDTGDEINHFIPKLNKKKHEFKEGFICFVCFSPDGSTSRLVDSILICVEKVREKWYNLPLFKIDGDVE